MANEQVQQVVEMVNNVLPEQVRGAYLFGSAVLGGLKPSSDLDIMVVSDRRTKMEERRRLIGHLLDLSRKPRYLEVTIVVASEVKPWRYPPRMDLQYGDWWRDEFERGDVEPWEEINPDLATLIHMVRTADTAIQGPPPSDMFDPIPRKDLVAATSDGINRLLQEIDGDTRNVVLTLARMWGSIVTGDIMSKDMAADWAKARLPPHLQGALAEARSIYVGDQTKESQDFVSRARQCAEHVVVQIQEHAHPPGPAFGST